MYWRNILPVFLVYSFNLTSKLCFVKYMMLSNIHNRTPKSGILFADLWGSSVFRGKEVRGRHFFNNLLSEIFPVLNLAKSDQIWIVNTIFWMIWHQKEFRLVLNQSESVFTIQIRWKMEILYCGIFGKLWREIMKEFEGRRRGADYRWMVRTSQQDVAPSQNGLSREGIRHKRYQDKPFIFT